MTEAQAERQGPARPPARQLIVLCHGVGANGADLIPLAAEFATALPHAAFAAPDAPEPYDEAPFGRQWWSLRDRDPARMAAGAEAARPFLDRFIDAELERLGLPPDAYALLGFSQGAMMVLHAGLRRAVAPRLIVAIAGALVAPAAIGQCRNDAPVLLLHGESDEVVPPMRSRDVLAVLQANGIPASATFFPGVGHWIPPEGLTLAARALSEALDV